MNAGRGDGDGRSEVFEKRTAFRHGHQQEVANKMPHVILHLTPEELLLQQPGDPATIRLHARFVRLQELCDVRLPKMAFDGPGR